MRIKSFTLWMEITAAIMLLMVLTISGCSQNSYPREIEIDESNHGETVRLVVGQELTLTLGSNPTTGFSWQLGEVDERVLAQQGEVEYISEAEEGVVGAGGVEIFHFTAESPGSVMLKLEYMRPWEEGVAPENVFSIEVVVE